MARTSPTPGIVLDPDVLGGKPTIAGTRIGVDLILEKISDGESIEDILRDYPHLRREQVVNALTYAAQLVRSIGAKTFSPMRAWSIRSSSDCEATDIL